MKRIFIIHGWDGFPEGDWFPWLKKELESKDFVVQVPAMPNTNEPKIDLWINFLKEIVGKPDKETYFVGHSIGCQTILRYLETLDKDIKIGGVVFVAGWINLNMDFIIKEEGDEEGPYEIANPWLETKIDWNKIKVHTKNFVAIFSDNDPYVPMEDSRIFKDKLKAKIIIEHNKCHFRGIDGVTKLPIVLESINGME
ncbi:MAG: alpha/beta hydrolase [Candidatus Woesearchaeota archaeon]|nr:alpha/beta hydrolase [Candidatus Woesearchaeota archaeon]